MGVDGQTAEDYEANLEGNLQDLLDRAKSGTYQAPPVRRVHIPKADRVGDPAPGHPDASFILHLFATGLGIERRRSGPSVGPVSLMRPNAGSRSDAWACASGR